MDDAGSGLRGLRARSSGALIEHIEHAYGVVCQTQPVDLGGSSNLNLLFETSAGVFVARVYRPYVSEERLRDVHHVRGLVDGAGVPCDGVLAPVAGEEWIRFGERLVEVERFVERDAEMDTWAAVEAGMPVLARMHQALRGAGVSDAGRKPLFANYIAADEALPATLRGTDRMRSWGPSQGELAMVAEAERLARAVWELEAPMLSRLPVQLVHGDFWDNNVFLRQGEIVFVTDFDFMGERWRIDDLALTIYFMCLEDVQQPVADDQLESVGRLLDAYDSASAQALSGLERAALPAAVARQPLWSIGGWVALLDDDAAARNHAAAVRDEIAWALGVVDDIQRWQDACA